MAHSAFATISVIDDDGRTLHLPEPARRVVTLSPSLAEIVFAIGGGERLVGVSSYSDDPPAALQVPVVSSPGRIDAERLRSLRPDLVIGWRSGNPMRDLARLQRERVPVFMTEPKSLADISRIARVIGILLGLEDAAIAVAGKFDQEIASLAVRGQSSISVFVEIWHKPLLTINGEHLMSDILGVCGATNVFAHSPTLTARISAEQLLVANPELLIASGTVDSVPAIMARWQAFKTIKAVRADRIVVIDPRILHRQGLRIIEGVRQVCAAVRDARSAR
ncbi:MAG: cobalamin-binding protein [Betaproteobacteria bacterium]|nr:cobalamin-binding protein [Betaproteobacteria bacterium]